MTFFDKNISIKYTHVMQIRWIHNKDNDIYRLNYTFSRIFSGYYFDRGIPLVFNDTNIREKNVVRLPRFDPQSLLQYKKYFPSTSYEKFRLMSEVRNAVYPYLESLLNKKQNFEQIVKVEDQFNEISKHFIEFITKFFSHIELEGLDIQVYPTMYGTQVSNDILKPSEKTFAVFIRNDAGIYELVAAILSGLLQYGLQENYLSGWLETQTLVNWLIRQTVLSELVGCSNQEASVNMIYKIKTGYPFEILTKSNEINEALNIASNKLHLAIGSDNKIYFNNRVLELINWERGIMLKFLENPQKVLDYYEIADLLKIKEENFSLWAISKRIQRLRETLDKQGVGGYKIQNVRGQGFILSNV